jgi:type IV secretory pathway VirB2 component (pilin)
MAVNNPVQARADARRAAMVSRTALARYRAPMTRVLMALLWLFSLAGTVLSAMLVLRGDGWRTIAVAMVVAVGYQLLISAVQWIFAGSWHPLYFIALIASVAPSAVGYWRFGGERLVAMGSGVTVARWGMIEQLEPPQLLAYGGMMLCYVGALALVDILPERTLVRD